MQITNETIVTDILEPMEERIKRTVKEWNNINTIVCWNKNKGMAAIYSGYDEKFRMNYYTVKLFTKCLEKTIKVYENKMKIIDKTAKMIIQEEI